MKTKKIIFSIILLCILILLTNNNSYAAVAINGGTVWNNITASSSYAACYNMRNGTSSTLGTNTLEPHLTLNSDWGAVAYLAISDFGAVTSSTGPSVTLTTSNSPTEGTYTSSTGNASGVMNFGTNHTQTSSLYNGIGGTSTTNLTNNIETIYVETLSTTNTTSTTKGQAFAETSGWFGSNGTSNVYYPTSSYYVAIRVGYNFYNPLSSDYYSYGSGGKGGGYSDYTFRPVIWNHAK